MDINELRWKSFYELALIAARTSHLRYKELENTRLIMWAAGNWKKGTRPEKIIPLPTDQIGPKPNAPRNMEHAMQIVNSLSKYLPSNRNKVKAE